MRDRHANLFCLPAVVAILCLLLTACGGTPSPPPGTPPGATVTPSPSATLTLVPPTETPEPTSTPEISPTPIPQLRDLADARGFFLGAEVQVDLLEDELYRETVVNEFNLLSSGTEMSMCVLWPERNRWDFSAGDAIVQFALENEMRIRGWTLVETDCLPEWLTEGEFTPEETSAILQEYITTLVSRYQGVIAYWDVIKESAESSPVWEEWIGSDYRQLAFQWALEADPQARLFYSISGAETVNEKSDQLYEQLITLLEDAIPVHGVSLQMHLQDALPPDSVASNIDRLNELGLTVHITEFNVANQDTAESQARIYADMLQVCLNARDCPAFLLQGFTAAETHIFDETYQPRPAYDALYQTLQE